MKNSIYNALIAILAMLGFAACSQSPTAVNTNGSNNHINQVTSTPAANPAIVWQTNETFQINRNQSYSTDTYWVMNGDGSNATRIYNPGSVNKTPFSLGAPHWSPDGNYICFLMSGSIYKMNISVVNGVPTAGTPTKLLDTATYHIAPSDNYWSFGTTNEIIFSGRLTTDKSTKIYAISGNGGTPTSIYTTSGTNIKWIDVSPDGSKILFEEYINGCAYLKVINRSDGSQVYSSIQVTGTGGKLNGCFASDWSRTSGSTNVCIYAYPVGSTTPSIFKYDVSDTSSLTLIKSNARACSWSPDDSKIVYTNLNTPNTINTITIPGGTVTTILSNYAGGMHWKK